MFAQLPRKSHQGQIDDRFENGAVRLAEGQIYFLRRGDARPSFMQIAARVRIS